MNNKLFFALQLSIITLFATVAISCNESALTNKDLQDIGSINAEIEIHQSLEKQNDNYVSVNLYDSYNKEIRNDTVKIFINNNELEFRKVKRLYYTNDYFYYQENIKPTNNKYNLEIELPNGKKYFLAEATALKTVNKKDILYPEKDGLNQDFTLSWSAMGDVSQLIIGRATLVNNPREPNVTSYNLESDTIAIKDSGHYAVAKSKEKIPFGSLNFTAQKTGTLNPDLLKNSKITITGNLEIRMDNE